MLGPAADRPVTGFPGRADTVRQTCTPRVYLSDTQGPGHSLTVRRRLLLGLPARLEIGSGALAGSLPVVDGVEQPPRVAVYLMLGEVAAGVVGQYAVRVWKAVLVVIAQHRSVGQSTAAGESAKGEQPEHGANFTILLTIQS